MQAFYVTNLAGFYSTAVKLWKVKENFPRHPQRH